MSASLAEACVSLVSAGDSPRRFRGGLAKALRAFPPVRDRIRGRGVEAANPFVQRRAPIQVQGALFEESSDGSDLGLHAGIAGEHRIDLLPRFRCKPRLAPERLGASPQSPPCRQVDRIGVLFKALRGNAPAEFHERLRAEPLRFRPKCVHGLAHPFAFVGYAGQPDACRIVELRSLALAEQPEPLAAKLLRRVDPLVQRVKRLSILTPDRRAKLTPLSGTAEVVPVANRGDPRGFV